MEFNYLSFEIHQSQKYLIYSFETFSSFELNFLFRSRNILSRLFRHNSAFAFTIPTLIIFLIQFH